MTPSQLENVGTTFSPAIGVGMMPPRKGTRLTLRRMCLPRNLDSQSKQMSANEPIEMIILVFWSWTTVIILIKARKNYLTIVSPLGCELLCCCVFVHFSYSVPTHVEFFLLAKIGSSPTQCTGFREQETRKHK